MSFEFNSFRPRRYQRSRFLDGDFLLSQEGTDLQLEVLEYARRIVSANFDNRAINDGWKVQVAPAVVSTNTKKLIVRPGTAYYDGLQVQMDSGLDPKVNPTTAASGGSLDQPATVGDVGGKLIDFTSTAAGYYKILDHFQEERVTALQDTFLQGAAVPETTEEKRRLIHTLVSPPCDSNGLFGGKDPLNFTRTDDLSGTDRTNFFTYNDKFIVPITSNTTVTTSDTLGSDWVVTLSNDNGGGTLFPTGSLVPTIFTNGLFIDADGTPYYINNVQVSTGPDQIAFTLSGQLLTPAGTGIQSPPNLANSSLTYTLVAADVVVANSSNGVPTGARSYPLAVVFWNGTDFTSTSGSIGSGFGFQSSNGAPYLYNIKDLRVTDNNQFAKLVRGGNWSWDSGTSSLAWDASANIQLIGIDEDRNTLPIGSVTLSNDGDMAYVMLDKNSSNLINNLTPLVTNNLVVPSNDSIFVIARRLGTTVSVGASSFRLINGESKPLDAGISNQNLTFIGATDEADSQPQYSSHSVVANNDPLNTAVSKLDNILSDLTVNNVLLGNGESSPIQPIAPGTPGNVLTSTGSTWVSSSPSTQISSSNELLNLGLSSTNDISNDLIVALKQSDGSTDPSTGPATVKLSFRSSTLTSGAYNERLVTAALSITAPSGASFGLGADENQFIYVYALDNAGTVVLALAGSDSFDEGALYNSTTISGSSIDNQTLYSTSGLSSVPIRLIGRIEVNEAVAGVYTNPPIAVAITPFTGAPQSIGGGLNLLYNPEGLLAQRVDPVGGTTVTNNNYGFDRWKILNSADGVIVNRVDDPAFYNKWAMKYQKTVSTGQFGFEQILEFSDSEPLRNTTVTFQGAFRSISSRITQVSIAILGWEGTPDTLSTTNIVSSWASTPTFITNIATYATSTITIGSTFANFNLTATVGPACNNVIVFIYTPNSQVSGDSLTFTSSNLVLGSSATSYIRRKDADEIALCQRYYEKTTSTIDIKPGTAETNIFHSPLTNSGGCNGDTFETTKFQFPTVITYDANGTAGQVSQLGGGNVAAIPTAVTTKLIGFISFTNELSTSYYYTADADF